jgi:transcriptional regulator GlxA family with amidase domain
MRTVGILLFDNIEVLDFCGPFEVFSVTGSYSNIKPFKVVTIAEKPTITAKNGLSVNVDHSLEQCPHLEMLVLPGGKGTRTEVNNDSLIRWIRQRGERAELVLSVCTGSLLLAKSGLADGCDITTHWEMIDLVQGVATKSRVLPRRRFIDSGRIISSAGISAGIDMSLYVVERLLGRKEAEDTAKFMEYDWFFDDPMTVFAA